MWKLNLLLKIWQGTEEILAKEEINNLLLLGTDSEGKTAWYLAAKWGNLMMLHEVWEWAKEKLTTEEININLLLATDNSGLTAWHWAACNVKLDILLKI